ncbi:hypothetical protein GQ600_11828 [Phytophthora cactorum]|nr:hypothetical protein GQ600_11828 [Phytophthora cactorum]
MRDWLAVVEISANGVDAGAKTQVLGFVLREMLFRDLPVSAITGMLDIMESSQIQTSRAVLQRVVRTILDDSIKPRSPHEAIKSSLEFWKTRTSVQNSVYLVYLLIHP